MRVTKTLLLAGLLALSVAAVGCTTGNPFGMSTLHAPGMSFKGNQPKDKIALVDRQTDVARAAYESTKQVAQTHQQVRPTQQSVQPAVHQTSHGVLNAQSAIPLKTLGPTDNFREIVENAEGTVLVDFYADWCGPCRKQGGILHEMEHTASQMHASIIKVNIDQHQQLAREFNVSSLPTLLVIKNGRIIERQTGLADHQRVSALLSR